jgi:hypothetical protein
MLTSEPGKPNSRIRGISFFRYALAYRRHRPSGTDEMRRQETSVVIFLSMAPTHIDCQALLLSITNKVQRYTIFFIASGSSKQA